ncbi:MAG: SGNH/GDSL hydrolase family protein [Cyclobacteriaceae bacterium]|mgnify:FL=1|nr:SGNH/GDSL hydrolase family protein [Cyclobacteriaceae bacterium]MDX5465440.1 SGNH/GDSL hydrolase family protein [Cyclobacteriaceae bacterium]
MALLTKKDIKSFFTITLPTLILMLVIVELALYWLAPVEDPFARYKKRNLSNSQYIESQFKPNAEFTFEIESGLPKMDSSATFTTNNFGYRGDSLIYPKPPSEFRVFIIGGSTTENLFIDDSKGFERQLQGVLQDSIQNLTVKVYNAGKSGDATPDHISMLVHRIQHLHPDLVILFPGINDLNRLIGNYDYLHFPVENVEESGSMIQSIKFFLSNFQIIRRLINVINPDQGDARTSIFLKTNYAAKVKEVEALPLVETLPSIDYGIYERNIRSFVGAAKSNRVPVLLMTQTHTWDSKDAYLSQNHWMVGIGNQRYPSEKLAEELGKLNQITIQVAEDEDVFLLDLEKSIPKTTDYFYDDCHFNLGGVQEAAKVIGNYITSNLN